jgi:hypothetical protein
MALGTLVGGALALGGAVLSGSSQNKAAKNAANATQYAADQSAAVLRENYDKSAQALAPWQSSGLAANNQMNALLGLGGGQPMQQQAPQMRFMGRGFDDYSMFGGGLFSDFSNQGGFAPQVAPQTAPTAASSNADAARAAFDQFRNSTGYQFRRDEGIDALNSGWAGRGAIKSGAAGKAFERFGQDFASNEFGNYFNMLGGQANKGLSAASAQAGVSQNLGNNLANIQMQQGENLANAALSKTNPFGNALSMLGGGLLKLG